MANGYRFTHHTTGGYFHPQQQSQNPAQNSSPSSNLRSRFTTDISSPSRSPDLSSSNQNPYGMYGQAHPQGQHGRVNGASNGQRVPMMYNYQHQSFHQHQQIQSHTQHYQNHQENSSTYTGNGSALGHHTSYSSGAASSTTPTFTPNSVQNGLSSTPEGGQVQGSTKHWDEQLQLYKAVGEAHDKMVGPNGAGNHYARDKSGENTIVITGLTAANLAINAALGGAQDRTSEDRGRPSNSLELGKRQDWHNMDMSGQGLRVLAPPLFAYTFLNVLYISSNKLKELPTAIGKLRLLTKLDASFNELTRLPPELGMCVHLKQLLLFNNRITTLPNELGSLYHLEMLGIEGNPSMERGIMQAVMENGTKALICHLLERAPVPLPPTTREIIDLQEGLSITSEQERFKLFCYNILCNAYVTKQQHGYVPTTAQAWDYRRKQILHEIQESDAEFVCLQEVDTQSFNEFFTVELQHTGYKGVHWPKARARLLSEKDAVLVDGCATFYKTRKYVLLDKQVIDIRANVNSRTERKGYDDLYNRVQARDNIAVVSFFENIFTGGRLIIVNAHLHWDPNFADVKIMQTAIIMEEVFKLAEKYTRWPPSIDKKNQIRPDAIDVTIEAPEQSSAEPGPSLEYTSPTQIPLILCGDLNSLPGSGVYNLLAKGCLQPNHEDLVSFQYGKFTREGIQHPFLLRSSYASLDGTPDALPFTNYTPGFIGHIDYIWYSLNVLEVTSLMGQIDPDYMGLVPGFPNYHFPSDHISLLAEFVVKARVERHRHPEPDFGPQRERRR